MIPEIHRLPRFGLFHGLHALARSGHPVLGTLLLVLVVVAVVMAVRTSRRRP